MKMIKQLLLLMCLMALHFYSHSQVEQVLELKKQKYYSESNRFYKDTTLKFIQKINYDNPNVIDDGYEQTLTIDIIKSHDLMPQQIVTIGDTAVIKCRYSFLSVWHWEDRNATYSGTIKCIKRTKRKITLDLDVRVTDLWTKNVYGYKGIRVFTKGKA